ncbi:hypothetical protein F8162_20610 [Bacillus sp. CH140a_4T]|nr:hypothetical protein F8162_20610 [Bacillus sp. CH140a_4T]
MFYHFITIYTKTRLLMVVVFLYPAIYQAVRPLPQNSAEAKKLGGGSTARKSPIGSTNNQWEMNPPPTD